MEALKKYEELKLAASKIADELKELEPEVTKIIASCTDQKTETDHGMFYFTIRRRYKFTDAVKAKAKELDLLRKKEKETVDFDEQRVLNFRAK